MKNLSQEEMVEINGGTTVDHPKDKERSFFDGAITGISSAIGGVAGIISSWF